MYTIYMHKLYQKRGGLIKFIVVVVVLIIILGYFSLDIRGIIEHPQVQKNFAYLFGWVEFVWDEYLARPVLYFWDNVIIGLLWKNIAPLI